MDYATPRTDVQETHDQSARDSWDDFISDLSGGDMIVVEGPAPKPIETTVCRACGNSGRMPSGRFCLCPAGYNAKKAAYQRKATIAVNQEARALAWAEAHREDACAMFRTQLSNALGVHLPLMRAEGHLTKDDLMRELIAACLIVMATDKAHDAR